MPENSEYTKVSKKALLDSTQDIAIDLFIKRMTKDNQEEYVLFSSSEIANKAKQKISGMQAGVLYIKNDDYKSYVKHIESSLTNIAEDPDIDMQERSEIIYNCASDVLHDTFNDPRSGENIKRSREVVNSMIALTLKEPGAVKSLLNLGQKDYYTFSHCVHVSVFTVGLAKVFGITKQEELYQLGLGAILHDVGKCKIDSKILNKPGKLTPEEFDEIKQHPKLGYDLMKDKLPLRSLDIILHHHEKYNGLGYPDGLSKGEISFFAKIAAIADVYDALTTNRVYAKARSPYEAIMTMKQEMVGHFEEQKYTAFIRMLGPNTNI